MFLFLLFLINLSYENYLNYFNYNQTNYNEYNATIYYERNNSERYYNFSCVPVLNINELPNRDEYNNGNIVV